MHRIHVAVLDYNKQKKMICQLLKQNVHLRDHIEILKIK